jgi:hypothetical protein
MRGGSITLVIALSITTACAGQPPLAAITDGDLVVFMQRESAPVERLAIMGDAPAQMINKAPDGRRVAVVTLARDWRFTLPETRAQSLELLVLDGELRWDDQRLSSDGYAWLPSLAPPPVLAAGSEPPTLLLFLDPPRSTDGAQARLIATDSLPWRPGVVASQDTGQALKLEVKDLRWVASTGQRTWLLRAGPELAVPWEIHDGVEEGYLLSGDYRIGECLPGRKRPVTGDYAPGGYFYRPGGIVHSGPESGSRGGALWLLRTPTRLTVEFVDGCPDAGNGGN